MSDEIDTPEISVVAAVSMTLDTLTKQEVGACFMSLSWNETYQPGVMGMDKLKPLFTEQGGTKMHPDAKQSVMAYLSQEFSQ